MLRPRVGVQEADRFVVDADIGKQRPTDRGQADEALGERGGETIGHVTPHGLRRTFASPPLAARADVPYVMAQLGHADPKLTLGVYANVIATSTDHGAALDRLLGAAEWAPMGTTSAEASLAASPNRP